MLVTQRNKPQASQAFDQAKEAEQQRRNLQFWCDSNDVEFLVR